jgi:hypothetical protein
MFMLEFDDPSDAIIYGLTAPKEELEREGINEYGRNLW